MPTVRIEYERDVFIDNQQLQQHFTRTEARLFNLLMRSTAVVTVDMYLSHLYGGLDEPDGKIFNVYMHKIRRKLGEHGKLIENVWGRGYKRNREYVLEASTNNTMQIDISIQHVETIEFFTGKTAQVHIAELVKNEYQRLQEM